MRGELWGLGRDGCSQGRALPELQPPSKGKAWPGFSRGFAPGAAVLGPCSSPAHPVSLKSLEIPGKAGSQCKLRYFPGLSPKDVSTGTAERVRRQEQGLPYQIHQQAWAFLLCCSERDMGCREASFAASQAFPFLVSTPEGPGVSLVSAESGERQRLIGVSGSRNRFCL